MEHWSLIFGNIRFFVMCPRALSIVLSGISKRGIKKDNFHLQEKIEKTSTKGSDITNVQKK